MNKDSPRFNFSPALIVALTILAGFCVFYLVKTPQGVGLMGAK